ncbi:disease resistance protein L6-like [Syzygium oleosum]|uniref:disease resistance protein L6-like n=1 Tax=Syzygium oleosum TaxID=219896 RepID=UPI0024B940CC|nr:disease resistance protein L6-like [Syzygium oleosum]XP_056174697.1 disease resistance protein L6-like [Syzygium oleosum]XP_056174698.1 disease resistance protein L6-like [Syzygium oleosum]XP_056174699.1 disease resistance protein L6-like [Syzygium oleosum]
MSADSTSWGSTEHEYDVFLSFRGSDTRKGIADQEHPMGSQFGLQLLHAIAQSKISIPVLYESHASSEWCLCELVQMVENRKNTRHLTGRLGEAFHSHKMYFEQRDVEAGQQALRDVSFLKGWESEKIANGHLGEFVRIVVETVLSELRQGLRVDVPETLVGIDDHKKIIGWLDTTSNRIRTIGIYGIGGIGKITFTFGEFVHRSFPPDIQ